MLRTRSISLAICSSLHPSGNGNAMHEKPPGHEIFEKIHRRPSGIEQIGPRTDGTIRAAKPRQNSKPGRGDDVPVLLQSLANRGESLSGGDAKLSRLGMRVGDFGRLKKQALAD